MAIYKNPQLVEEYLERNNHEEENDFSESLFITKKAVAYGIATA